MSKAWEWPWGWQMQCKICQCPTPGTDKAGKWPAVAWWGGLGAGGIDWCIMQINTQMLAQGDCLQFSTVAAYSFSLEDVNVSDLILGHPLFSPFSVVQIFGILKKIYKKLTMIFTRNNSFNLKNEHSKSIEKKTGTFFTVYCAFC